MAFRLQTKGVHLTYKGHIDHDVLKEKLQQSKQVQWFSIVWESSDGENSYDHTHAACGWISKVDIRRATYFDVTLNGENVHPHIQNILTPSHANTLYTTYHTKAVISITQSEMGPGQLASTTQRIKDAKTLLDACGIAGVEIRTVSDVKMVRDDRPKPEPCPRLWEDGIWLLPLKQDFKVMFIWGTTNTGKTQWAIHSCRNPLVISNMDELKDFDPLVHDCIIFDDMSFAHMPREAIIHLLDWDLPRSIHCRYFNALIPANTRKIITSNKTFQEVFPYDESGAIRRRITWTQHVTSNTFSRLAVPDIGQPPVEVEAMDEILPHNPIGEPQPDDHIHGNGNDVANNFVLPAAQRPRRIGPIEGPFADPN